MCEGTRQSIYTVITRKGSETVNSEVIHEQLVSFFVNGQELATIMATPCQQDAHALGFLANEGIIETMDDVRAVHICPSGGCVDVWLARPDFAPPRRMILTSGCGGGVTFDDLSASVEPLTLTKQISATKLWDLMDDLNRAAELYSRAGGVHTSILSDSEQLLLVVEDVGRHNTLDKLRGLALQRNINTQGCLILTTGRVSSEMINKARHMEVPIIASRTSPTSLSVSLADQWNITLIGYLRRNSMNVYTHPQRVIHEDTVLSANGKMRKTTDA